MKNKIIEILKEELLGYGGKGFPVRLKSEVHEAIALRIEEEKNQWISVDDRLPELNITVTAYEEELGIFPAELDAFGWFDLEAQVFLPPHQIVIKWTPLPNPPKAD